MSFRNAISESSAIIRPETDSPLADLMNPETLSEERVLQIPVSQIRTNTMNFYDRATNEYSSKEQLEEEELVEGLADVLLENGQDTHAIVYADETPNDGKSYTLIAGSRRFKAVQFNMNRGGDGILLCKVIPKPENQYTEILRIIQNNGIRTKDKKTRSREVEELSKVYEHLKAIGEKPKGRKIEWIGSQIGLSSRQVGRYLKEPDDADLEESNDTESSTGSQSSSPEPHKLTKEEKNQLKEKAQSLSNQLGLSVKINSSYSIVINPAVRNEAGLDNLIQQLQYLLSKSGGEQS